jgi:hypothetical protein
MYTCGSSPVEKVFYSGKEQQKIEVKRLCD